MTRLDDRVKEFTEPEAPGPNDFRWNRNNFFSGGMTKRPTLNDLRNEVIGGTGGEQGFDTTDRQLATEILNRAGLVDRPFYYELLVRLTDALSDVDDTKKFVNPIYGANARIQSDRSKPMAEYDIKHAGKDVKDSDLDEETRKEKEMGEDAKAPKDDAVQRTNEDIKRSEENASEEKAETKSDQKKTDDEAGEVGQAKKPASRPTPASSSSKPQGTTGSK